MPAARPFTVEGFQGSDLPILSRVQINGVAVTQSQISSISLYVRRYIRSTGEVENTVAGQSVAVSHIYNTLQTDARWDRDTTGYNFAHTIDKAAFPGPDEYEIIYMFEPSGSGNRFPVLIKATMISLQGIEVLT